MTEEEENVVTKEGLGSTGDMLNYLQSCSSEISSDNATEVNIECADYPGRIVALLSEIKAFKNVRKVTISMHPEKEFGMEHRLWEGDVLLAIGEILREFTTPISLTIFGYACTKDYDFSTHIYPLVKLIDIGKSEITFAEIQAGDPSVKFNLRICTGYLLVEKFTCIKTYENNS